MLSRSVAISRIAEAQFAIGDVQEGLATFKKAAETAAKLKGHSKNWCAIENIRIRALADARIGNQEAARQKLLKAIPLVDRGKEDLIAHIALSLSEIGAKEDARRTFAKALSVAMGMKNTYAKGVKLKNIARCQAKSGDIAGAKIVASKISKRYEGGKNTYKEEALAEIDRIAALSQRDRFMAYVFQQAGEGKVKEVAATIKDLNNPIDRCAGYVQIALGLLGKSPNRIPKNYL
jgi:tetratricopeptide (TPR) repeat protein